MDNGIQVHFQDRLMHFLFQQLGYTFEMKLAGAFYQDLKDGDLMNSSVVR